MAPYQRAFAVTPTNNFEPLILKVNREFVQTLTFLWMFTFVNYVSMVKMIYVLLPSGKRSVWFHATIMLLTVILRFKISKGEIGIQSI